MGERMSTTYPRSTEDAPPKEEEVREEEENVENMYSMIDDITESSVAEFSGEEENETPVPTGMLVSAKHEERFRDLLNRFKRSVERDEFEAFWDSRSRGRLKQKPEEIARSLLTAFVKGKSEDFVAKEVPVGGGRVDVLVVRDGDVYPIEIKMWRGREYVMVGLEQILEYVKNQEDVKEGYYLVFDPRSRKKGENTLNASYSRGNRVVRVISIDINPPAPSKMEPKDFL